MRRVLPLVVLACLLALPAAASARPFVGIADQKAEMFTDARFQALGIRRARISVAWDALRSGWQTAELDDWMAKAKAADVEPLVTFAPSRLAGQRRAWPTPAQFVAQFKAFRARYPWVKNFSTWNEANFCGFGPCREPALVASWWRALSAACPTCTILGADVLDLPSAPAWVKAFVKAARKAPKVWGYHNYITANRMQIGRTKAFLAATGRSQVWFTETGGIVSKHNKSTITLPQGAGHAAKVTQFIFQRLVALSPRVKRVYLYQWNSASAADTWDSGFFGPDGTARPALAVLQKLLGVAKLPAPPPLPVLPLPVPVPVPAPVVPAASPQPAAPPAS